MRVVAMLNVTGDLRSKSGTGDNAHYFPKVSKFISYELDFATRFHRLGI